MDKLRWQYQFETDITAKSVEGRNRFYCYYTINKSLLGVFWLDVIDNFIF